MTTAQKRVELVMLGAGALFIASCYFSIAVNSLSLGLMAICWLLLMALKKKWDVATTGMEWFFLAYIVAEMIATAFSLHPGEALLISRRVLLIGIVYFFATHLSDETRVRRAVTVLLGTATLVAVYGTGKALLERATWTADRLGIFQFYMTTSELMMMATLLTVPFVLHPKTPGKIRWIALGALVPIVFSLYATVTRGAYVAAAAGLLFIVIRRDKRLLIPLVLVFAAAIYFSPPYIHDRITSIVDLHHPENASRQIIWKAGLKIFADHPITGVGDIDLGELLLKYQDVETGEHWGHMHNVLLNILVTLGVIGLAAFIAMMWRMIVVEWKILCRSAGDWFRESFITGALALLIGFHVMGLTEWSFGDQEVVIMVWLTLGIAVAIGRLPAVAGKGE